MSTQLFSDSFRQPSTPDTFRELIRRYETAAFETEQKAASVENPAIRRKLLSLAGAVRSLAACLTPGRGTKAQ
jgi:hypothetical protein